MNCEFLSCWKIFGKIPNVCNFCKVNCGKLFSIECNAEISTFLLEQCNTIPCNFRSCSWHQLTNSPNPQFFYRNIYLFIGFFWIEIIQPFLNLKGASKCISQHHWNNHNTKFRWKNICRLVKMNWWIDVTNKILI